MDIRKRKRSCSNEEILARFSHVPIKECHVDIVKMDIEPMLLKKKPLTNKDIQRILEDSKSDESEPESMQIVTPQNKNRLRKKENGMVFIPRSKYNEHPAKNIVSTRKSKRNKTIIKVKLSPRFTRNGKKTSQIKVSKNNNSIYKKTSIKSPANKSKASDNKQSSVKKTKTPQKQITEYQLVFSPPKSASRRKRNSKSLKSLSDFVKIDSLPSKLWEIERVPPLISNIEEDDITKELMALTEENKENLIDESEKNIIIKDAHSDSASQGQTISTVTEGKEKSSDSNTDHIESTNRVPENINLEENIPNSNESDETSLKDELEALLSSVDTSKKIETKEEGTPLKDDILSNQVDVDITKEDIEKTIKDVEMEVDPCHENVADETITEPPKMSSEKIDIEEAEKNSENESEGDVKDEKTLSVETKEIKEDNEINEEKNKTSDDCIALRRQKRSKKEKFVHFEDKTEIESEEERHFIKSLIFRKYAENKKTYEKVVVFCSSMEYTVTINNKQVELIGAPEEMTSIEDLKILLQIVDESNLDSFNVICKS